MSSDSDTMAHFVSNGTMKLAKSVTERTDALSND